MKRDLPANDDLSDQRRYARLLGWGSHAGLALLVGSFVAYIVEILPPLVPHERVAELWSGSAEEFLEEAGIAAGGDWLRFVHHGDILNLAGIALLALCSAPCIAAIMPIYWASRERALFAICALELVVLLLAASGFGTGAH